MNLAALKSLIERLADDGFTTTQEKLIALALVVLDGEIQQCDIIETLILNAKHCRNTLKSFEGKNVVEVSGKRDVFYRMSPSYRKHTSTPQESLAPPQESLAPPVSSPFCVESLVNLTQHESNLNNLRAEENSPSEAPAEVNREDSFSLTTQASASSSPGEAGQADEGFMTMTPPSPAPAVSPRSAGGAANTAAKPRKRSVEDCCADSRIK